MKKESLLTFAQFICLLIIFFGLGYYAYVTVMSFTHAVIPPIIMDIKGNVNIWMTSALSFGIGTTVSSQNKDKTIADLNANIKDAIAATPPTTEPKV